MTTTLDSNVAQPEAEYAMDVLPTFVWAVRRDLLLALRSRSEVLLALIFFVIVASLFPLGVGPEPKMLATIAPGVVWVCALLACLLSLPRLFATDYADGTLEQILIAPCPLLALVGGKVCAADDRLAAGLGCPSDRRTIRARQRRIMGTACFTRAGHADIEPAGGDWRRAHLGSACRWRADRSAGAAAVCPSIDFWRGRRRGHARRPERQRAFVLTRGRVVDCARCGAVGGCGVVADRSGIGPETACAAATPPPSGSVY